MDKNIFTKNKKYNPDVIHNLSKRENERTNTSYTHSEEFFKLKSRDGHLMLKTDDTFDVDKPNLNLEQEVESRIKERNDQETNFKGAIKNVIPSSNPNEFHHFNDLKNINNRDSKQNNITKKMNDHERMMDDLVQLGIIN